MKNFLKNSITVGLVVIAVLAFRIVSASEVSGNLSSDAGVAGNNQNNSGSTGGGVGGGIIPSGNGAPGGGFGGGSFGGSTGGSTDGGGNQGGGSGQTQQTHLTTDAPTPAPNPSPKNPNPPAGNNVKILDLATFSTASDQTSEEGDVVASTSEEVFVSNNLAEAEPRVPANENDQSQLAAVGSIGDVLGNLWFWLVVLLVLVILVWRFIKSNDKNIN